MNDLIVNKLIVNKSIVNKSIAEETANMQKHLRDIDLYHLYKKWYDGCGMFECFVHSTPFVTLKNYPDFVLNDVCFEQDKFTEEVLNIISQYINPKTLFLIDFNAQLSLKLAYILQEKLALKPILTFRQINHPYGLVFDEEAINSLISYSEKITDKNNNGFVFVLDYLRYSEFSEDSYKSKFNNQYEVTEYDLPVCEMLNDLGYEQVVFLHQGTLKEDIKPYIEYLQKNGIQVVTFGLNN